jgi:hypothetical protein
VGADEARIVYRASRVCTVRRRPVTLYRNGKPPFRDCRDRRGETLASSNRGRIFAQAAFIFADSFAPDVYACLFESPRRRFHLGVDWDDEEINLPALAGPFAGYEAVSCGGLGPCFSTIHVKDLRGVGGSDKGSAACDRPPKFGPPGSVGGLVLKDSGSVAWTVQVTDSQPRRLVCALDAAGRRLLDSGAGIDLKSLKLTGSNLTWLNGGVAREATLQ